MHLGSELPISAIYAGDALTRLSPIRVSMFRSKFIHVLLEIDSSPAYPSSNCSSTVSKVTKKEKVV